MTTLATNTKTFAARPTARKNSSANETLPPGLWAATVLPPSDDRHADLAKIVVDRLCADRPTMRGVSAQHVQNYDAVARWLIEVLYQAFCSIPSVPAILCRTPSRYSSHLPNAPRYGHAITMRVLDAILKLGWADQDLGSFDLGVGLGRCTRIQAAGQLWAAFKQQGVCWAPRCATPMERLILISDKPKGIPRRFAHAGDDSVIERMQRDLYRINEFILDQCIRLEMPDRHLLNLQLEPDDDSHDKDDAEAAQKEPPSFINFGSVEMRRIFAHGSLSKGGRFYGPWWQNVPSTYRQRLVINDDAIAEVDYSGIATVCLYARLGVDPGQADMYDIGIDYTGPNDPRRKIVKKFHNAKLNDMQGWLQPTKAELTLLGLSLQELHTRLEARHPAIYPYYGSGIGLEMQFVDSQIAEAVMLRFLDMGEVCLTIHDSFIVKRHLQHKLKAVMQEEFEHITGAHCDMKLEPMCWDLLQTPVLPTTSKHGDPKVDAILNALQGRDIAQAYYASWSSQHHDEFSIRALDERGCLMNAWLRGSPPGVLRERLGQLAEQMDPKSPKFGDEAVRLILGSQGALLSLLQAQCR